MFAGSPSGSFDLKFLRFLQISLLSSVFLMSPNWMVVKQKRLTTPTRPASFVTGPFFENGDARTHGWGMAVAGHQLSDQQQDVMLFV